MLNPDEVVRLSRAMQRAPDAQSFAVQHGFEVQRVLLDIQHGAEVIYEEFPAETTAPLRVPSFLLGTPPDASCLAGIISRTFMNCPRRLYHYRHAQVVGWRSILTSRGELFCGGQIDTMGKFEKLQHHSRGGYEGFILTKQLGSPSVCHSTSTYKKQLDGTGLFIGMLEQGNYGSFLFRCLPQFLLISETALEFDYLIVGERTPWLMNVVSLVGLDHLPIYTVREVYAWSLDNILILDEIDNEGLLDDITLQRITRFINYVSAATGKIESRGSRLYLSRALSATRAPSYRVLTNEIEVESAARLRGFKIVHPETYSFTEQCSMFRRAESIMGPSGSGMLNSIFAPEGSCVADLEVFHNTVRQHAKLYSSSEKVYGFVFGEPLTNDRGQMSSGPWKIDLVLVNEALDLITK